MASQQQGRWRSPVLAWSLSRAATVLLLWLPGGHERLVEGDVRYYAASMHALLHGAAVQDVLREYPLPVLAILLPQYLVSALRVGAFVIVFPASMLAVDAAFSHVLWRGGRRVGPGLACWLVFVPVLGPIVYFRFDLVPSVLTALAVIWIARRPVSAGAVSAAATALKLWPVIVVPILASQRERRPFLRAFTIVGAAIAVAVLAAAGWARATSPLSWQGGRGLQIESVPATPLMLWRLAHRDTLTVHVSRYQSAELFGPGVRATLDVTIGCVVLAAFALLWLWLRTVRAPSRPAAAWLLLTAALTVTVTNKTLSPQYLLWIGACVTVVLVVAVDQAATRRVAAAVLVAALLTQLEYPVFYTPLVVPGSGTAAVTVLVAIRNLVLCGAAAFGGRQVWRMTRADQP